MCVIPALRQLRQEDQEFKARLGYIVPGQPELETGEILPHHPPNYKIIYIYTHIHTYSKK
jgi:hypothetical protein